MERSVGGVLFHVIEGDITRMGTDAVVNAANNHFWMGGGVAGAIKHAGGAMIEIDAMNQGPVPVGQSVVTNGGSLDAGYVIHAAVMGQDLQTSAKVIHDGTRSALECAHALGVESVSFPAFGTGVGGYPPSGSAREMIDAALDFVRGRDDLKLKEITFVLFSDEIAGVFSETLVSAIEV
jgi:O-acetyl-ADP-ribose deacetylase (regulator of RNase III)